MSATKFASTSDAYDDKNNKEPITEDDKTDSNMDDTVHYLSPASLTVTTLQPEDDRFQSASSAAFLRYLHIQGCGFSGEFTHSLSPSSESVQQVALERTLAIIKPDVVPYEDVVVRKIVEAGFKILQKRKIHLTPEQVSELFAPRYGLASFPYLVVSMSSGPVVVLCLAAVGAVAKWRDLVRGTGMLHTSWFFPKSVRLRFGVIDSMENVLHASEDLHSANREIRFFFPQMILEPLLKEEPLVTDYLSIYVNPTLLNGLTELCKKKPIEPILYFSDWLLQNNPYQPKMKPEIAKLPT